MTGEARRAYVIRPLRRDETEVLKDFLYEAIFVPEGIEPPDRNILEKPELRVYTDGFGTRKGDNCLVADMDGKIVGAAWTRIMDDYGHVDDETPSFAISLYKAYRAQGIGSAMMRQMLDLLRQQGYQKPLLRCRKRIMPSGCTRLSAFRPSVKTKKSSLWYANYEQGTENHRILFMR